MKIHFVKAGETLSAIADKHGVTVEDLLKANPIIADPDDLKAAMKLVIPDRRAEKYAETTTGGAKDGCPADEGKDQHDNANAMPEAKMPSAPAKPDLPPKSPEAGGAAKTQPGGGQKGWEKWPSVPALPDLPEFAGSKPKASPCQTCQPKGPGAVSLPLPYAQPQTMPGMGGGLAGTPGIPGADTPWGPVPWGGPWTGTGGAFWTGTGGGLWTGAGMPPAIPMADGFGLQHPFAAIPQPAYPVQGMPGQTASVESWPGPPGGGPAGAPHGGGSLGGGLSAGGNWGNNPPVAGQTHGGPWGSPGYGMPWNKDLPGSGLPGNWAGFHSPYNTPFPVNPYQVKPDRPAGTEPGSPEAWQPYRSSAAKESPAFIPPHAMPARARGEEAGDARLHHADQTGGEEPGEETLPPADYGRRKSPAKKKKRPAEPTLKERIIRMQRNHRRY